jgi:cell wall-associated protease
MSIAFPIQTALPILSSLTANRSAPQPPGSAVTFTTGATGGIAPYQFKWFVSDGATWTVLRDWSTSSTITWTPSTPNPSSAVGVWVRNASDTADQPTGSFANAGGYMSMPFPIQASLPTLSTLTANRAAPQPPGSPITFTTAASSGVAPYQFKWWIWDGVTWTVLRGWSTSSTVTWTPSAPNPNSAVGVWVRNAGDTADQPTGSFANTGGYMSIPFPIQASFPTLSGLTANLAAPLPPGLSVTFTAAATGGVAPYQFKWWISDGASWTMLRDWSTSSTIIWTPSTPNPNSAVGVWVRNAGDTADQPSGSFANTGGYTSIPFPID